MGWECEPSNVGSLQAGGGFLPPGKFWRWERGSIGTTRCKLYGKPRNLNEAHHMFDKLLLWAFSTLQIFYRYSTRNTLSVFVNYNPCDTYLGVRGPSCPCTVLLLLLQQLSIYQCGGSFAMFVGSNGGRYDSGGSSGSYFVALITFCSAHHRSHMCNSRHPALRVAASSVTIDLVASIALYASHDPQVTLLAS